MLQPDDGDWVAEIFGLGRGAQLVGPVDRGEQGHVWRLVVGSEAFAVKESFHPLADDQAEVAYDFQRRAAPRRTGSPPHLS